MFFSSEMASSLAEMRNDFSWSHLARFVSWPRMRSDCLASVCFDLPPLDVFSMLLGLLLWMTWI